MDANEDFMLSEVSQAQKDKGQTCFLSYVGDRQYKYKQYYGKQVMLRGYH
jgi:hypothetical protein